MGGRALAQTLDPTLLQSVERRTNIANQTSITLQSVNAETAVAKYHVPPGVPAFNVKKRLYIVLDAPELPPLEEDVLAALVNHEIGHDRWAPRTIEGRWQEVARGIQVMKYEKTRLIIGTLTNLIDDCILNYAQMMDAGVRQQFGHQYASGMRKLLKPSKKPPQPTYEAPPKTAVDPKTLKTEDKLKLAEAQEAWNAQEMAILKAKEEYSKKAAIYEAKIKTLALVDPGPVWNLFSAHYRLNWSFADESDGLDPYRHNGPLGGNDGSARWLRELRKLYEKIQGTSGADFFVIYEQILKAYDEGFTKWGVTANVVPKAFLSPKYKLPEKGEPYISEEDMQ